MRTTILTILAGAGMAAIAAPAGAAGWTPTVTIPVGKGSEPVPRVAIAADGTSALAFRSKSGKLMLSTGRADGRFTAPRRIDQSGVRDWSVAARAGGGFIVAWQDTDGIHTATRTRAGRPTLRRLAVRATARRSTACRSRRTRSAAGSSPSASSTGRRSASTTCA